MNNSIAPCRWQATLRLKTLIIAASKSGEYTLIVLGGDAEGESNVQH